MSTQFANLTTTWVSGIRKQKFHFVPELEYSVLLGQDFISANNIVIDIFSNGWYQGSERLNLVRFDLVGENEETGEVKRSRSVLQSLAL